MIRRLGALLPLAACVWLAAGPQAAPGGQPGTADGPSAAKPVAPVQRVAPATPDDLELRPGTLVQVTDAATGQPYWVFSYVVANKTGKPQRFAPRFELVTGEGRMQTAGSEVPPEAQRRLQRMMGKMEAADQFQIMGEILEGEANAREGFAVFSAKSGDTKELTLYIAGLSRAQDTVVDPSTGAKTVLRRTLRREYSVPGVVDPRVQTEAPLVIEAWVMR
jgi:hypothetical protein